MLRETQGGRLYLHHVGQTMLDGGRNGMRSRGDVQFRKDAFYVESDGPFTDAYDFSDLPVCLAIFYPV